MKLFIHGVGIVNGYGSSATDLEHVYAKDFCSIQEYSKTIPGPCDHISRIGADTSNLTKYLPKKKLRRIDHFSRMALLAAGKAIQDTNPSVFNKEKTGVIVASGYGALSTTFAFLDSYLEKGDDLSSPIHFSNSVHNAAAAHISICYGIQGPSLTVSQFDMSFVSALLSAGIWLEEGKVDSVLIGSSDEYCDVLGYCIHGLSQEQKKAYSFSESATFFLVTAQKEEKSKYGWFDKVTMGNYTKDNIKIPEDSDLIISASSTSMNYDAFFKHSNLSCKHKTFNRNHCFSPTDSSIDAAFATRLSKKISYIKLGQNKEYGTIIIHPNRT